MKPPQTRPLREALRAQFQEERLDAVQLDALRARLATASTPPPSQGVGAGPAQPERRDAHRPEQTAHSTPGG